MALTFVENLCAHVSYCGVFCSFLFLVVIPIVIAQKMLPSILVLSDHLFLGLSSELFHTDFCGSEGSEYEDGQP